MTLKDLKKRIQDLPDEAEIILNFDPSINIEGKFAVTDGSGMVYNFPSTTDNRYETLYVFELQVNKIKE